MKQHVINSNLLVMVFKTSINAYKLMNIIVILNVNEGLVQSPVANLGEV